MVSHVSSEQRDWKVKNKSILKAIWKLLSLLQYISHFTQKSFISVIFISFEECWVFCFHENLRKVTYRSLNKYGTLYYWVGSKTLYTFSCINLNVQRVPQSCKHGAEKQWSKNPYGYISLSPEKLHWCRNPLFWMLLTLLLFIYAYFLLSKLLIEEWEWETFIFALVKLTQRWN